MAVERVIGLDPGWKNPGAALMRKEPSGWYCEDLPVLKSQGELLEWMVRILREPPPDLKLIACELVVNTMAVKWHEYEHNTISLRILEVTGAGRLMAACLDCQFFEIGPQTVHKIMLKGIPGVERFKKKQQIRELLKHNVKAWPKATVNLNRSDAAGVAIAAYRKTMIDRLRPIDPNPKTVRQYLHMQNLNDAEGKKKLRKFFREEHVRIIAERRAAMAAKLK